MGMVLLLLEEADAWEETLLVLACRKDTNCRGDGDALGLPEEDPEDNCVGPSRPLPKMLINT